jgi:hypothetical protein
VTLGTAAQLLAALLLPVAALVAGARPRTRKLAVPLLFCGYAIALLFCLADRIGSLYLPNWWFGGFIGFLSACGCLALLLIWTARSPRRRWPALAAVIALGAAAVVIPVSFATRWVDARYLRRRDLNDFALQVEAYGRIRSLREWEGPRTHALNGTVVRETRAALDSVPAWPRGDTPPALLRDVLVRDSIDPAVFREVVRKLRSFEFEGFTLKGDYLILRRGRDYGLVHTRAGAPVPAYRDTVPGTGLRVTSDPVGRWVFYHCCVQPRRDSAR